jgi:hypothetical protein
VDLPDPAGPHMKMTRATIDTLLRVRAAVARVGGEALGG